MDGHFVPAISFGTQMIDAVHKRAPQAYLDCHMMVSEPLKWVEEIAKAGGSSYTFHLETCKCKHLLLTLLLSVFVSFHAFSISNSQPRGR